MEKTNSERLLKVVLSTWQRTCLYGIGVMIAMGLVLLPTTKVFASSEYDHTLVTTSDLEYKDIYNNIVSVSGTWRTHMATACGSTVYNDFLQALDGGAWAVSQGDNSSPYGITVVWSKSDHTIPTASFYTLSGYEPAFRYLAVNPGWQGKASFHFNNNTGVDYCNYSTVAVNNPYGSSLSQSGLALYESTYEVNYPSGYEGDVVPGGSAVPFISGDAQCGYGNNQITSIHVIPSTGANGYATLSDDGNGGKNYKYYLSEVSTYQLQVVCDGSTFLTPSSLTSSDYSWVCTFEHGYICAES